MQAVGQKGTGPEIAVRQILRAEGFRFQLNRKDLAGSPDIVFASAKKVIFVNGCFWHAHSCSKGRPPKSRLEYWTPKLTANVRRDLSNRRKLWRDGWRIRTVWQCQVADSGLLARRLIGFLAK